jgi:intracellular septation protein A
MVVTVCPFEMSLASPNKGNAATGQIRIIPYIIRSRRENTRHNFTSEVIVVSGMLTIYFQIDYYFKPLLGNYNALNLSVL